MYTICYKLPSTILFIVYRFYVIMWYWACPYLNLNCREQNSNHIAELVLKRCILHTEATEEITWTYAQLRWKDNIVALHAL